ncbi:MAG: tyrosine-type recombinase/integrase [Proteobacteria bacterium]|nr:tyrosine-type recombinase/integrase [Pseudomonadota bacterium]
MPTPHHVTPTLQGLIELTRANAELAESTKSELCSAIRKFASICCRTPADIIADPAVIRQHIKTANWKMGGLSKRSWENLKSKLTRAMKLANIRVDRRRRNFKLLTEWDALLAQMSRKDRDDLHRFAGWCSALGVLPEKVDQVLFDRWRDELEELSIQINPRERWHRVRRAWNRTLPNLPGSSFLHIWSGEQFGRRSLPWIAFAPQLLAEVADYERAVTGANPFDIGKRKPVKPVTVQGYISNLRLYVSDLINDGMPADDLSSLRACVEPQRVKRGLDLQLAGRPLDEKTRPGLSATLVAILSVANYVALQEQDIKKLRDFFNRVRDVPDGMCERNERRLAQFEDPVALRAFVNLPFDVSRRYADVKTPTVGQALDMQLAALLAILLFLPVRIKNAADIDLEKHLRTPVGGRSGRWLVHFAAQEVKNGKAIDGYFNEAVSELLARYVEVFRPVLLKQPSSRLFVSQHGKGKSGKSLSMQFSRFVKRETGLIVHAHLMRHFAAFAYLKANPGDYESVRQMLGHKNIATTVKFYAKACTLSAYARYDEIISTQIDASALATASFSGRRVGRVVSRPRKVVHEQV